MRLCAYFRWFWKSISSGTETSIVHDKTIAIPISIQYNITVLGRNSLKQRGVTDLQRHNLHFWGGITMPIGPWELIVILIIALLVFGPKRLPDMGRSLGKAIREFRNAGKEIQNDIAESIDENERDSTKSANKTV